MNPLLPEHPLVVLTSYAFGSLRSPWPRSVKASVQIIANSDEEDDELNVGDDQLSSLGDEDDNYMHSDFDDSDEESEAQLGKAVREDDEEAPTLLDPAPSEAQSC